MKLKIRTNYRTCSDMKLLMFGYQVSDTTNNNPLFLEPFPTQAVLHGACDAFRLASSKASKNDRALSSAKNDKRAELIEILDQRAEYVTGICNGDKTMLLNSGFEITGVRSEAAELQAINEIKVQSNMPGQMSIRIKRVVGAKTYIYQCTPDPLLPDSTWESITSLNRECTFTNLKSVTRYWFRVVAIGKGDKAVYSPPVARVVE